jgi:3-(3-hydroxy-phenyl)propionate hydroxylase
MSGVFLGRQVAGFAMIPLDISDFPTRHNYGLALWRFT